jgi:hypothetical protein
MISQVIPVAVKTGNNASNRGLMLPSSLKTGTTIDRDGSIINSLVRSDRHSAANDSRSLADALHG